MKDKLNLIYEYLDNNRESILKLYEEIVNLEGWYNEPENVNIVAERLKAEFEKEGLKCKLVDVGPNGKTLVGVLNEEIDAKPVIFSGHMDTVFPKGTFGDNPFKIVDGKAYGPGVLDMKGGIIISLYVIKALNSIGYNERPIKVIYSGDEEACHAGSTGAEVFLEEGKGGICAFNMETGLINNDLCIGRKGRVEVSMHVEGVEAHSGNDFLKGRNAIEEAAYKIIDFRNMTDLEIGTTVNVGKIQGGTMSNAVPKDCSVQVDIRLEKADQMDRILEQIKEICGKTYIDGTTTTYEILSVMAAYETNDDIIDFYNFVKDTSEEFGLGEINSRKVGGSSDASYITLAGTPVICSFGIRGEWNHTVREYAVVESLFERSKLIATVIMNLENFKG